MRMLNTITGEQWMNFIGKGRLQNFQDRFAKVNNISMVFTDTEGKPLTV